MTIGCTFISVIGGYECLLVPILFIIINVSFVVIILIIINDYFINGH